MGGEKSSLIFILTIALFVWYTNKVNLQRSHLTWQGLKETQRHLRGLMDPT